MILLIDNYDSFTYNLYQYAGLFCRDIKVFRNDKITIDTICRMKPDRIILSPGPGSPNEAGICVEVIKKLYTKIPILGICLGHQCIAKAFGGAVSYAKELFHGRQSPVVHDGTGVLQGLLRLLWQRGTIRLQWCVRGCQTALGLQRKRQTGKLWQWSTGSIRCLGYSSIRNRYIPGMVRE